MLNSKIVFCVVFVLSNLSIDLSYSQIDTIFVKINNTDSILLKYDDGLQFDVCISKLNESLIEITNKEYDSIKVLFNIQTSKEFYTKNSSNEKADFYSFASDHFYRRIKKESDSVIITSQLWKSDSMMLLKVSLKNGHLWYCTIFRENNRFIMSGFITNKHAIPISEAFFIGLVQLCKSINIQNVQN